jgi:hypothetical protein
MKTSMKVILTAVSIAAVASPITARSLITHPQVEGSTSNISIALAATGTRLTGWMHQGRFCQDCVKRIEP